MGEMVVAGKVRAIGVSEVTLEQLEAAHRTFPLAALQSELSLWAANALARSCRGAQRTKLPSSRSRHSGAGS